MCHLIKYQSTRSGQKMRFSIGTEDKALRKITLD
jgi:hypothetical protein